MRKIRIVAGICILLAVALAGGPVLGQAKEVVIKPVGNKVLFDLEEITAKAGTRLVVIMDNIATNPSMAHNFVLLDVRPADNAAVQRIGLASVKAGEAREYIPEDEAVLAYTPMAAPGMKTRVEFTVPPPGEYVYMCSYLGHYMQMRGVFRSVP